MRKNGELLTGKEDIKTEVSYKWVNTLQLTSDRIALELSGHVYRIDNYVYLRPFTTRLTIRGYFPVFQYQQTDALLAGGDLSLKWKVTKLFTYEGKASYLYATDRSINNKLTFIPPAQFENALTYLWTTNGKLKDVYITLSLPTVLKQFNAPRTVLPKDVPQDINTQTFDFMDAPPSYTLINIAAGTKIPVGNREFNIILSAENILNTSYRNYMNRLRYYADDTGRNISLRIKYTFHTHD